MQILDEPSLKGLEERIKTQRGNRDGPKIVVVGADLLEALVMAARRDLSKSNPSR